MTMIYSLKEKDAIQASMCVKHRVKRNERRSELSD